MRQLFKNSNQLVSISDVYIPEIDQEEILVRVIYSAISTGTETSSYNSSGFISRNVVSKSRVGLVLDQIKTNGIKDTFDKIRVKYNELTPTGYSGVGEIVKVGKLVNTFVVGDIVSYMSAPHAEYVIVNPNLVCRVPEGVKLEDASLGAIACIGLHGVRLSQPSLGESCLIIGLGMVGLFVGQFAKNSGLDVYCIDPDKNRRHIANQLGLFKTYKSISEVNSETLTTSVDDYGFDILYLCASSTSKELINDAMSLCRDRARVILVGDLPINLDRDIMFSRELSFCVSRSYGPGRYSNSYEKKNYDYPIGYVRWTEQRNLGYFLKELKNQTIDVSNIISKIIDFEHAEKAFNLLTQEKGENLCVVLKYNNKIDMSSPVKVITKSSLQKNKLNIVLIGCGAFAQQNILKHFDDLSLNLYAVVNKTNSELQNIRTLYPRAIYSTNYKELMLDNEIDAFIVATRHDSHYDILLNLLKTKKPIYVEKPLAINFNEILEIQELVHNNSSLLTIGYNRRFAKSIEDLMFMISKIEGSKHINYRINAPSIPLSHWIVDPVKGGGRLIGEGVHFLDLVNFITKSEILNASCEFVSADLPVISRDNFTILLKYYNGQVSKESIEIFIGGTVFIVDNFMSLKIYSDNYKEIKYESNQKGFYEQLNNFSNAIKGLDDLRTTVVDAVNTGRIIEEILNQSNVQV
jgi:predicted dehydrogenase/threonine dehydrogenase-like Zn-dependent dehydrogenase